MKITKKAVLGLLALSVFTVGCANNSNTVSEESLGLRKTNLYSEASDTVGTKTHYTTVASGS
jgi:cytochrome c-type protein NapB